jgi:hypothetical protein
MSADVTIEFLNHASVRVVTERTSLVSDPWFSGPIFNDGWDLLWTSDELAQRAADSDFIWISHEHPDHFSPAFFRRLHGRNPEVLFQETRDGRVAQYLRGHGFRVRELKAGERILLSSLDRLTIGKNGLYDSWNLIESPHRKILNLNDCILKTPGDLRSVRRSVGDIDVLLTQFSYAGWVGKPGNRTLRERAAQRRLDIVRTQIECLRPRYIVPFASFGWFCHEENAYLNDSVNRISDFLDVCAGAPVVPIILAPGESWDVGNPHQNRTAIEFWQRMFAGVATRPRIKSPAPTDLRTLVQECEAYRARTFARNSKAWMSALARIPVLDFFHPVRIRLTDLNTCVQFSFFDGLDEVAASDRADAEMSSDSLVFIFRNDFGFDTLMANARFSASKKGLDRMLRNFALGNVNAMGWSIGRPMVEIALREAPLVWLVLRELGSVNPD